MDSPGYLANLMARLFAKGLQERISSLGITAGQFPILLELWKQDGLSQKQIVERIGVEQATVANTLNRMARDKLIKREQSSSDGRVQLIRLTKRAKELQEAGYKAAWAQNDKAMSKLSREDTATFVALSNKVIEGLRE